MKHKNIPAKSIKIPELDIELDTNHCMNTRCSNFGLSWYNNKSSYSVNVDNKPRESELWLRCESCKKSSTLHNNESINKIFLWTLKNNLLHEYCPNKSCLNHKNRVNFYEHSKRYSINDKKGFKLSCRRCKKRFTIGQATRLEAENKTPKRMALFQKLICNNTGPRGVVDILEYNSGVYMSSLRNLSSLLKEVSGYYFMKLNNPKHPLHQDTINLYSDMLAISIHSPNNYEYSHNFLNYIITSTTYSALGKNSKGSFIILAITPFFMPDSQIDDDLKQEITKSLEPNQRIVDNHLNPLSGISTIDTTKRSAYEFQPLRIGGYYLKKKYAITAHCLLLDKMLCHVKHINHFSDSEAVLANGIVLGFAKRIQAKTCDVVFIKTNKDKNNSRDPDKYYAKTRNMNKGMIKKELEQRIKKARKSRSTGGTGDKKQWVFDPSPPIHEQGRHFLWINKRLDTHIGYEIGLYKNAKIQPIDMPFAVFRKTSSSTTRPVHAASKGSSTSYDSHAELPRNAFDELSINIFYWNFQIRYGAKRDTTRGFDFGISNKNPINMKTILNWRKNIFNRAKTTSRWSKKNQE